MGYFRLKKMPCSRLKKMRYSRLKRVRERDERGNKEGRVEEGRIEEGRAEEGRIEGGREGVLVMTKGEKSTHDDDRVRNEVRDRITGRNEGARGETGKSSRGMMIM
jgi:hypothetical protein